MTSSPFEECARKRHICALSVPPAETEIPGIWWTLSIFPVDTEMGENEDGSDGRNGSGGGKVGDDTGVCVCVCVCVCIDRHLLQNAN